jgi:hypothetical protein
MNITPDWITELKDNEIFVFGSNQAGRHGKGAAKLAMKWGAKYGQGFGIAGKTFAIPTMNASVNRTLSIENIKRYVDGFINFVILRPELDFLVTEIGCGLAGLDPKDVAPLFSRCYGMHNVYLPKSFIRVLNHENSRGI